MSKDSRFIYTVTQTSPAYEDNVGASVTVLVTDKPHIGKDGNVSENQNHTALHGTAFTFKPRSFAVTNTYSYTPNGRKYTFTLFKSEPGNRIGGADGLLDGGMHSGTAASRWITNSTAVLEFVRDFVEVNQFELNTLILSSRAWGKDNEELLNEAHTVTGISVLSENVQTAFLASLEVQSNLANTLVTKYVATARPELNNSSE